MTFLTYIFFYIVFSIDHHRISQFLDKFTLAFLACRLIDILYSKFGIRYSKFEIRSVGFLKFEIRFRIFFLTFADLQSRVLWVSEHSFFVAMNESRGRRMSKKKIRNRISNFKKHTDRISNVEYRISNTECLSSGRLKQLV